MKHARSDYDRIQDPWNKIPADEPVFLIRGQDVNAPEVVAVWADLAEEHGASAEIVASARAHAEKMKDWQRENFNSKTPDL